MNRIFFSALILIAGLVLLNGCEKQDNQPHNGDMHEQDNQSQNGDMHEQSTSEAGLDSSIIRSGDTDIASLDENNDSMLFQCPMHFEVISDNEARCPKCKMFLEAYPVEQARDNFHKMGQPL